MYLELEATVRTTSGRSSAVLTVVQQGGVCWGDAKTVCAYNQLSKHITVHVKNFEVMVYRFVVTDFFVKHQIGWGLARAG